MKNGLCCLILAIAGCGTSNTLQEGRWDGSLSPMNHLDSSTPIEFDVTQTEGELTITLIGPDGNDVRLLNPILENETLRYSFHEPEQGVLLTCELDRSGDGHFEGRCTDSEGKWALFKMIPPSESPS